MNDALVYPVIRPAGDAAVSIDLGNGIDCELNVRVHSFALRLGRALAGMEGVDILPGYSGLLVRYDPVSTSYESMCDLLKQIGVQERGYVPNSRRFVLPTFYGGEYGPDLDDVARHHGITPRDVVDMHVDRDYPIFCLGFSPGFPFLGGLIEELHTPRLETPRPRVPAGSVAIGGRQTGVYPTSTPGGWRLIGRTPYQLFDATASPPVPFRPGDCICFVSMSANAFERVWEHPQMLEAETPPESTSSV